MSIRTKIRQVEIATSLGLINESDWKTPRIISGSYRKQVTRKVISNAAKAGRLIVKKIKK